MIYKFKELPSTNKYAMENISKLLSYDVIVCESQTSGYGVSGRWENKAGNLFYTIILDNFIVSEDKLPFMILNSMHQVVSQYIQGAYIKLPNDLYVMDKKIGGFIVEKKNDKYIIGIGINVNGRVENHISVKDISKQDTDLDIFIDSLTRNIMMQIIESDDGILKYFNDHVKIIGEMVRCVEPKSQIEYEDKCISIDFENVYFKNSTVNIKKFSSIQKND